MDMGNLLQDSKDGERKVAKGQEGVCGMAWRGHDTKRKRDRFPTQIQD